MSQTEDFRKSAPAPLAPRSINLPEPEETVLANNLKIVVVEDKRLPLVSFRLCFKAGRTRDPVDAPGLSSMTASLLNEGTATRTSLQIAEEIERIGGSLGASAGFDNTIVAASALAGYGRNILELMADIVLNPSFPEKELALAKENTIQNLHYQRSQPNFLSEERLALALYGEKHPYSRVTTTPEVVNALTRETLGQFHRQTYIPNNAVLIVVGDVEKSQLLEIIENLFGSWQPGEIAEAEFPAAPTRRRSEAFVVDRPGSAQTNLVLANIAINRTSPDYFPVLVMNQVLGGGAPSRLFMNLREEKGFTYGAYSSFDMRRETGNFEASAEVRTDVTGASLKEFFREFERIREERVEEKELQDVKNYLTGIFPIRLETQEGLINQLVTMQLHDLPADYLMTYRDKINQVGADEVQRVARLYVTPDRIAVVAVGDAAAIAEQIAPHAEKIEYFDAAGKAKETNKTMNTENANRAGSADGKWNLTVSSPQGDLPISLNLKTDNGSLSGTLSTPLGDGEITGGEIAGDKVSAIAGVGFQGQRLEVKINGTVSGDTIKGSVAVPIPGFPEMQFTGARAV